MVKKYDSAYIMSMMKDIKKMPDDVIEMYSKFYRGFKSVILIWIQTKNYSIGQNKHYLALGNMMTAAALTY
jgi:hypothetical protein